MEIVLYIGAIRLLAVFFLLLAAPFVALALGWLIAIHAKKAYYAKSEAVSELVRPLQED